MAQTLLRAQGAGWQDLSAIAVGVGPGNFTGIRIGVAAARGLALGLSVPAIGVSLFQTLDAPEASIFGPADICVLAAPHGHAYVQHLRFGKAQAKARLIDPDAPPRDLDLGAEMRVIGYRAADIARPFGARWIDSAPEDVAARIALIAARCGCQDPARRPAPLYVRAADATPARDAPVPILP